MNNYIKVLFISIIVIKSITFQTKGQESAATEKPDLIFIPAYVTAEYSGHDFVTEEVKVLNRGNAPLKIQHLKPSCTCLSGIVERSTVPPMGIGKIKLNINTIKIQDTLSRVDLYIYTNQRDEPFSLPIYLTKSSKKTRDSTENKN